MSWLELHLGPGLPQPLDPPIAATMYDSPSCERRRAFPANTGIAHPDPLPALTPIGTAQLVGRTGAALEKSLFSPFYSNELNSDEREVAVYLDGEEALTWWHRNVARSQYGIQGWKKGKIYPDFIFAVQTGGAANRLTVLETKGDQLDNLDAAYKRDMMSFLSDNFSWDDYTPAGELELVKNNGDTVQCTLILMSEWRAKLPTHLQSHRAG